MPVSVKHTNDFKGTVILGWADQFKYSMFFVFLI